MKYNIQEKGYPDMEVDTEPHETVFGDGTTVVTMSAKYDDIEIVTYMMKHEYDEMPEHMRLHNVLEKTHKHLVDSFYS